MFCCNASNKGLVPATKAAVGGDGVGGFPKLLPTERLSIGVPKCVGTKAKLLLCTTGEVFQCSSRGLGGLISTSKPFT